MGKKGDLSEAEQGNLHHLKIHGENLWIIAYIKMQNVIYKTT